MLSSVEARFLINVEFAESHASNQDHAQVEIALEAIRSLESRLQGTKYLDLHENP